ncbi:unnamed protein product [Caenorhabditis sp. 36 PRJEB53466]|nr:unnamed protein product [Caenorhabditis sp. 36 PRJEB53466]
MEGRTARTSITTNVEFDDNFIKRARCMPAEKLIEELMLLQKDDHPLLRTVLQNIDKYRLIQEDRIKCHRKRAELRATTDLEKNEGEIQKVCETTIAQLFKEAKMRSEELEKAAIHEYGVVDINKPQAAPLNPEVNKKTLRGRGGGQLVEPNSYFTHNASTRIPEMNFKLAFDDDRIRQDLNILNQTDLKKRAVYTVSIQKPKLMIDSKSFKHGEDVYAQNSAFGDFLAKIDIVNDHMIHLKGVKNWDTRQISATLEDLEEGRVTIKKQKGKDKGA